MNFQNLFAHSFCKEPLEDSRGACVRNRFPYLSWIHICTCAFTQVPISLARSLSVLSLQSQNFLSVSVSVSSCGPFSRDPIITGHSLSCVLRMSERACFIVSL